VEDSCADDLEKYLKDELIQSVKFLVSGAPPEQYGNLEIWQS